MDSKDVFDESIKINDAYPFNKYIHLVALIYLGNIDDDEVLMFDMPKSYEEFCDKPVSTRLYKDASKIFGRVDVNKMVRLSSRDIFSKIPMYAGKLYFYRYESIYLFFIDNNRSDYRDFEIFGLIDDKNEEFIFIGSDNGYRYVKSNYFMSYSTDNTFEKFDVKHNKNGIFKSMRAYYKLFCSFEAK